MSSPTKPGFSPGKPTVYTPQKKQPANDENANATQPDVERDESADNRPSAPQRPDIPDRSNPPLPVDLTTGKSVAEEDTKEMTVEDAMVPNPDGIHRGEDRRSKA